MKAPQAVSLPEDVLGRIGTCPVESENHEAWFETVAREIEPLRFDPSYRELTRTLMEMVNLARRRR